MSLKSPSIEMLKRFAKLSDKKYRDEFGLFAVEGYKNVIDTFKAKPNNVTAIVMTDKFYASHGAEFPQEISYVTDERAFSKITSTVTPQGIFAAVKTFPDVPPTGEYAVLLDRIRDPGNLGTIIRTAAALGFSVALIDCADAFAPKTVRSCMSAIVKTEICKVQSYKELVSLGYSLYACDMSGEDVFGLSKPSGKICLVIGNEADGVNPDIIRDCGKVISLPQENMESLNAAVAASVLMYQIKFGNYRS